MIEKQHLDEGMYLEYANLVKRFLIQLTRNHDLAEDLTQETFYQAYKSIDRYNGTCKLSVWLCQIAKHVYYDYLKKAKHFSQTDIHQLRETDLPDYIDSGVEQAYLIKEQYESLLDAVREAKYPYGEVFLLRAYEEMSFQEIGEIWGKSDNWARVTYYRAKEWLKGRLHANEDNV